MPAGTISRAERIAFLLAAWVVFAYVALRAFLVPVVHDEAITFLLFVETRDFLPFRGGWDAGNHVLVTGLGWVAWKVFGFHLWALRLPSLLAFVLYAAYAWRWGRQLRTPLLRRCLWAALLGMPFLLDFFSLFRGYGLSIACWSMALYELVAWLERRSTGALVRVLAASACATFSGLSLLTLWAAVLAVLMGTLWGRSVARNQRRKWIVLWAVLGLLPFVWATAWLQELSAHGSLYYGLRTGVFGGTVPSLLKAMFGGVGISARWLVLLAMLAGTWAAWRAVREKPAGFRAWALVLSAGLLWADVLGRELLFAWRDTLFPEDRTALQWVLPFLLMAVFALDRWSERQPKARWMALLLLVFPLRTMATANLSFTSYWPEQAIPRSFFGTVEAIQQHAPRLLTIGCYRMEQAVWAFGLRQYGLRLNTASAAGYPDGGHDLVLLDPAQVVPPQGYRPVEAAPGGRLVLYARDPARFATLLLDTLVSSAPGTRGSTDLWNPDVLPLKGGSYLLELELALPPGQGTMTGSLVVETKAGTAITHHDETAIPFLRNPALHDSLVTVRLIPPVPPGTTSLVARIHNAHRQPFGYSGRMRVYAVQ